MTASYHSNADSKLLVRGIRLDLDDTARAFIETKAERLFRHEPRILRLRIDVKRDTRSRTPRFIATGRVEIAGPDLAASVTHAVPSASITLLIDRLDRMLRKRTCNLMRRRSAEDIRTHPTVASVTRLRFTRA